MKKLFTLLVAAIFSCSLTGNAQIFWTENFESGSTSGMAAGSYGGWTTAATGTNGTYNNSWYVSCAENGHTSGICGSGCVAVSPTATLSTLHVGANFGIGGDAGASYFAGPLSSTTNQRAQSPTINCTGKYGITLSFNYIEDGDGTNDDATVWYYNGTTWALLVNTPKSLIVSCAPQGQWGHYSIALPASANNNPNVKIGFNWTDNDDGVGTDPSFAVDSVSLSVPSSSGPPSASMTASATTACEDSCIIVTNTSTGAVDSARWSCPGAVITTASSSVATVCFPGISGTKVVKLYLYSGGVKVDSTSTTITLTPAPNPVITKTGSTYSVPAVYTAYQWYIVALPPVAISGATNATYTTTVTGTYGVVVDSAGCRGIAYYGPLGLEDLSGADNLFWTSRAGDGSVDIHSALGIVAPIAVTIYDATGRQALSDTWDKGYTTKRIAAADLRSGLYIIKLSNNNTSTVLKWLKQ